MNSEHQPVLLEEAIEALMISADGAYVDGTFGRGGHSARILDALSPRGTLLALDRDPDAEEVAASLSSRDSRFSFRAANFSRLGDFFKKGTLHGILLDLGVSSPQLNDPLRGFSFSLDGPLDMRMDPSQGQRAADWIAQETEDGIARVLKELGEERFARKIASAIVRERELKPIVTTRHLADLIASANPRWEKHKHPATRCFQAIRLHINRELDHLKRVLEHSVSCLAAGGRLVVISFHSLEDRIVKRFIRDSGRGEQLPKEIPVFHSREPGILRSMGRVIRPKESELILNPRARSAVMRVAERVS